MDSQLGAGPLGLLIVVLIGIVTVLLIRNMNTRLRRLPRNFGPTDPPAPDATTDESPDEPPQR